MTITREEFDALVKRVSKLEKFKADFVEPAEEVVQTTEQMLEGAFQGFVARVRAKEQGK